MFNRFVSVKVVEATSGALKRGAMIFGQVLVAALCLATVCRFCGAGHMDGKSSFPVPAQAAVTKGFLRARHRRRRQGSEEVIDSAEDVAASYARFSTDLQREESNTDQQRTCNEAAEKNGHRILPELEFADEAVSGTKLRRNGLDAMLRAAEAGEFQVLYFHSLSRLARESVITMPMLKRLVYTYGVRVISVTEGIDSARDGWDVIATIMSLLHERYIKELAENVFRGQEGTVLAEFAVGDHRFGFTTEPVAGSEKDRKGRNAKPRMRYIIDPLTMPWVVRSFHWFVVERRSIRWIVKELNRRGAPKDHRSTTPDWHHNLVVGILSCEKYIGVWPWGEMKNVRDPDTGKIRQKPRSEEDVKKWTRDFPHLQIIDNETFAKAQQRLEENYQNTAAHRRKNGTLKWSERGSADNGPRHLLSQLVKCDGCGGKFRVGGANGKYLFCPGYQRGTCDCQTQLRRDRAERMILDAIGKRILANSAWLKAVYEALIKSWHSHQQQVPSDLAAARSALADVDQRIHRMVDRIEDGLDDPDIKKRLEERRVQRRELTKKVKPLERAHEDLGPEPTEEWLLQQLEQLGECLRGDTPAAAYALRDLVGCEIVVTEIREEGRQRYYLRGRFTIRSNRLTDVATGTSDSQADRVGDQAEEISEVIEIDFVDPNPLD